MPSTVLNEFHAWKVVRAMNKRNWVEHTFKLIRAAALWVLDGVAVLWVTKSQPGATVFVRVDAIGDFVLWFGSIRSTRDHFSGSPSVLICNQTTAELAACLGSFDEVIGVDINAFIRNVPYRWRFLRSVRRLGATVAVQPTFSRVFLTGDAIIRATGAATRVGSIGDLTSLRGWQHWIANRSYSYLIPAAQKPLMELERNCEFLRGLGSRDVGPKIAQLPKVAELSGMLHLRSAYFVVFPGAGVRDRMWPAEKFAQISQVVARSYRWQMVVCGADSETALADAVIKHSMITEAINLAGKTSLPELVEIIRGARLLIGNETSAVHIAAAVDTPCVGLVGGGHFGRFMPYSSSRGGTIPVSVFKRMACYGCNWRCIKDHKKGSPVPCIGEIAVPRVLEAIRKAVGDVQQSGKGAA